MNTSFCQPTSDREKDVFLFIHRYPAILHISNQFCAFNASVRSYAVDAASPNTIIVFGFSYKVFSTPE